MGSGLQGGDLEQLQGGMEDGGEKLMKGRIKIVSISLCIEKSCEMASGSVFQAK